MNLPNFSKYRKTSLLLCGFFLSFLSYGQQLRKFDGSYEINKLGGSAQFSYWLINQDTIFQGPFRFEYYTKKLLQETFQPYVLLKGRFENNKPSGNWSFTFADYITSGQIEKNEYHYKVPLSGREHSANGGFANQKFSGSWEQMIRKVENGHATDTLFKSSFTFKNGVPQNSFELRNEKGFLAGRIIEKALAHDKWELFSTENVDVTEIWYFENGQLKKIEQVASDSSYTYPVYNNEFENKKLVNLDSTYLYAVALNQMIKQKEMFSFESQVSDIILQNESLYHKIYDYLNELSKAQVMLAIQVYVEYSPLRKSTKEEFDQYLKQSKAFQKEYISFIQNARLNILKLSDENVFAELEVLRFYEERYHQPLQRVLSFYEKGVLDYVEMEGLTNILPSIDSLTTSRRIGYVWEDSSKAYSIDKVIWATTEASDYSISKYAHALFTRLENLHKVLDKKVEKQERLEELQQKEKELMVQVLILNSKLDSLTKAFNQKLEPTIAPLKAFTKKSLSDYSTMADKEKLVYIPSLIACTQVIDTLSGLLANSFKEEERIIKLYTDDKWNPFTSTVMSEVEKKRLVDAFKQHLMPYYRNETKNIQNCEDVESYTSSYKALIQKMMDLRDADTKKLERSLKSVDQPLEILRLLNLKAPLNPTKP